MADKRERRQDAGFDLTSTSTAYASGLTRCQPPAEQPPRRTGFTICKLLTLRVHLTLSIHCTEARRCVSRIYSGLSKSRNGVNLAIWGFGPHSPDPPDKIQQSPDVTITRNHLKTERSVLPKHKWSFQLAVTCTASRMSRGGFSYIDAVQVPLLLLSSLSDTVWSLLASSSKLSARYPISTRLSSPVKPTLYEEILNVTARSLVS